MKVKELIERLKDFEEEDTVMIACDSDSNLRDIYDLQIYNGLVLVYEE